MIFYWQIICPDIYVNIFNLFAILLSYFFALIAIPFLHFHRVFKQELSKQCIYLIFIHT